MAQTVQKVVAVTAQTQDAPGVLAQIMATLRDEGIALKAACGWQEQAGQATLLAIPPDLPAPRSLAAREGVSIREKPVVWVEGPDETGALCDFTAKLAANGVNIVTCHAIAAGDSFAAIFTFSDEQTVDRVLELTGA